MTCGHKDKTEAEFYQFLKKKQSQEKHFTLARSADAVEREPSSALTAIRTQQVCAAVADAHAACTTLVNV